MFSLFISTFYLFRKIFTCHREPSIHRGRARNIGLSYLAGDLKIIQARRSMHHRRDVNPGGGRNDNRDILSRWYSLQRFVQLFFMPIISNNSELHVQYNNVCVCIYIYICIHTVDGSEILHHLGCTKPINWCRISSINNIYVYICTYFSLGWSDLHQSKMEQWKANSSFVELKHGVIIIPTQTKRYCKGNPSKLQYICIVWMTPVKEMQEFWNQIKKKNRMPRLLDKAESHSSTCTTKQR